MTGRTRTQQPDAQTALATRRENGGVAHNTLADEIRKMEKQYQLAMPKGAEAAQLVRDALTAIRTTKHLDQCDAQSVLGGLMTCAQLGLRPGVLGHAWLLPFWDRKANPDASGRPRGGYKAQLVIGYQGLIDLAHRSGRVSSLIARTVYENDEFEVDYGVADRLVHKPNMFEDRGDPIAYYAIAKFTNGGYAFFVMSHRDAASYRDQHATAKTKEGKVFGPWIDHFESMAHKTCMRQLAKYMPKSTELAVALAVDEGVRVDLTPTVSAVDVTHHDQVIDGEVAEGPAADTVEEDAPTVEDYPDAAPQERETTRNRMATDAQLRMLHAVANKVPGLEDRDALLLYVSQRAGRDIESTKNLTTREASTVIDALNQAADQAEPQTDEAK